MLLIHTYFSLLKSIFTPFVSFFHWGSSMVLWIRSIPLCCLLKKKSVLSQWEIFFKNGKILIYLFDFYLVCPMELQCVLHFKELIYLFLIIFKAKIQMDENRKKKKKTSKEWVWCQERNPKDVSHLFEVVTLESNFANASIWSFSSAMCWILFWEYWRSLYRTVSNLAPRFFLRFWSPNHHASFI